VLVDGAAFEPRGNREDAGGRRTCGEGRAGEMTFVTPTQHEVRR
jgi:hypothetical protein